jgi:hypothetical protein
VPRSRSARSRFSETPSKKSLRGSGPVGRQDQETGPSGRPKRRIQGRETTAHARGRPLASEVQLLPFRRKTPKKAAQPRAVSTQAEALRRIGGSLGPKKR